MTAREQVRGPEVHRPASSAVWKYDHRWGKSLGDSTLMRVTRTDGGAMSISYGRESVEIRGELVERLAEMVVAAAAWSDKPTTPPTDAADAAGDEDR